MVIIYMTAGIYLFVVKTNKLYYGLTYVRVPIYRPSDRSFHIQVIYIYIYIIIKPFSNQITNPNYMQTMHIRTT